MVRLWQIIPKMDTEVLWRTVLSYRLFVFFFTVCPLSSCEVKFKHSILYQSHDLNLKGEQVTHTLHCTRTLNNANWKYYYVYILPFQVTW
jgi:hypothetical protein